MDTFDRSVFINCPFDKDYLRLLRPLTFTILYLNFLPRLALEREDSGEARIEKIIEIIRSCKDGIHDLSRLQAKEVGEFYRMNMPFELSLDFGCKRFREGRWKEKVLLILEEQPHRYQAALSDVSNCDIRHHKGEPEEIVGQVRDWFVAQGTSERFGGEFIWQAFNEFQFEIRHSLTSTKKYTERDVQQMPMKELMGHMGEWISRRKGGNA